jgi:hypothetical protein
MQLIDELFHHQDQKFILHCLIIERLVVHTVASCS